MNQQDNNQQDEVQPIAEEIFFDEETVQTIPAVVPLDETPTRTSARFRKFRVPMRKTDNSFNPAFLLMALLAVTALGVIAGTLLYRTAAEKSANSATDEPVNRTIPAQYQFVVEKPSSSTVPKDNLTSTTTAPVKKNSGNKSESSETNAENEPEQVSNEQLVEETDAEALSEDEEEPPPPAIKRERKEDKNQNKTKEKNQNAPPEIKENGENQDEQSSGNISN